MKYKNKKIKIISAVAFSMITIATISSTIISCATNNSNENNNGLTATINFKYQPRIYITKQLSNEHDKLSIHAIVASRTNLRYLLKYQWYEENTYLKPNTKSSEELVNVSTAITNANLNYYIYSNNKQNGYWVYFVKIYGYIILPNQALMQLAPVYSKQEEIYSYTNYSNLNKNINTSNDITNQTTALNNWNNLWSSYNEPEKSEIIKSSIYSYLNNYDVVNDRLVEMRQTNTSNVIAYIYKNVDVESVDINLNAGYLSYSIITKYGYADFSNLNTNNNLPNNGIDINNFFINVRRYYFTNITFTPELIKYENNYYAGFKINAKQTDASQTPTVPFYQYGIKIQTTPKEKTKQILAMNWNLPFVYLQNSNINNKNSIIYYLYQYTKNTLSNQYKNSYNSYSINSQNILDSYNGSINYGEL